MITLTITKRGQVTLPRHVLQHLGIQAGGTIEIDLLHDGRVMLGTPRPKGTGSIEAFIGMLAGKTTKVATLEEIDEAIIAGWTGKE